MVDSKKLFKNMVAVVSLLPQGASVVLPKKEWQAVRDELGGWMDKEKKQHISLLEINGCNVYQQDWIDNMLALYADVEDGLSRFATIAEYHTRILETLNTKKGQSKL